MGLGRKLGFGKGKQKSCDVQQDRKANSNDNELKENNKLVDQALAEREDTATFKKGDKKRMSWKWKSPKKAKAETENWKANAIYSDGHQIHDATLEAAIPPKPYGDVRDERTFEDDTCSDVLHVDAEPIGTESHTNEKKKEKNGIFGKIKNLVNGVKNEEKELRIQEPQTNSAKDEKEKAKKIKKRYSDKKKLLHFQEEVESDNTTHEEEVFRSDVTIEKMDDDQVRELLKRLYNHRPQVVELMMRDLVEIPCLFSARSTSSSLGTQTADDSAYGSYASSRNNLTSGQSSMRNSVTIEEDLCEDGEHRSPSPSSSEGSDLLKEKLRSFVSQATQGEDTSSSSNSASDEESDNKDGEEGEHCKKKNEHRKRDIIINLNKKKQVFNGDVYAFKDSSDIQVGDKHITYC